MPTSSKGEKSKESFSSRSPVLFIYLFIFILRRMGKNKSSAPTLPRIRCMSCFDLNPRSRCNSSSRCCYRARVIPSHLSPKRDCGSTVRMRVIAPPWTDFSTLDCSTTKRGCEYRIPHRRRNALEGIFPNPPFSAF